ncbi:helix-turn-helix domain-containing protein [Streptomyces sp. KR80]|uniref:helix-turn-helix domain-containing protein n=1 Tax=Streptomyces sp. KR80 TaxID=3457426 RepID=UPI003FD12CF3
MTVKQMGEQQQPVGTPAGGVLAPLGVSPADEMLYRVLLRHPQATLADLAHAVGWQAARVRRHLNSLESLGLLTRTPSRPVRYTPAAPETAVEVLALQRQKDLERARIGAALLAEEFRIADDNSSPVTVVRGRQAIQQRFFQAQQATRREVFIIDRPPYVSDPAHRQVQIQNEQLSRGVLYRTIYDQSSLDTPEKLAKVRTLAARGEESRVLADVPLKLVISDRSLALVPFVLPTEQEVLVLQGSALLDGLVTLFELLWQQAVPLWSRDRRQPAKRFTADDEQLLALAAAGLTDETIARRLGVAQRTVERRMRRVMDQLNAQTRFQAGLQAAQLGILGDPQV